MTADKIQVDSDMTPILCHVPSARVTVQSITLEYVSVFSDKIASGVNMVVRTDNQSVLKIHIWLSVTIFGCLGQRDNHYYEP